MMQHVLFLPRWFSIVIGAAAMCAFAAPVDAADAGGISVIGTGKASQMPSLVELTGTIAGEAQLAGDAVTKYRDNKRRAIEAIEALQIEGLAIEAGGVTMSSAMNASDLQAAMRGMTPQNSGSGNLSIGEKLTIRLAGADKLSTEDLLKTLVKIVDAGKDAGLVIGANTQNMLQLQMGGSGQASLARFKLADVQTLRQKAYEAAIDDARQQAERLAKLAGVKLGRVTSIRETTPQKTDQDDSMAAIYGYYYAMMSAMQDKDQDGYSSTILEPIPVTIVLQVEFGIRE